jgi:hypothetical protein
MGDLLGYPKFAENSKRLPGFAPPFIGLQDPSLLSMVRRGLSKISGTMDFTAGWNQAGQQAFDFVRDRLWAVSDDFAH